MTFEEWVALKIEGLEQEKKEQVIRFYVNGMVGMGVSMFGLVGNSLSGVVLTRRTMGSSSTYSYLTALAIVDFFFLLCILFIHTPDALLAPSHTSLPTDPPDYYAYFFPYVHPLAYTLQVCSVWLTVAFTLDRYLMICHPFKASQVCSTGFSRKVICCLLLFCLLFNLPKLFEYETVFIPSSASNMRRSVNEKLLLLSNNRHNVSLRKLVYYQLMHINTPIYCQHCSESTNNDTLSSTAMSPNSTLTTTNSATEPLMPHSPNDDFKAVISLTPLGSHALFRGIYHLGFYLFFVSGLPFVFLLYFNFKLVNEVWRARRQAETMGLASSERRRTDTTVMLISVVVVFFTCQIPALFSRVCYFAFDTGTTVEQPMLFALNEVGNLLIVINSSINILPYYLFGRRFRQEFMKLLRNCLCCRCRRHDNHSWS